MRLLAAAAALIAWGTLIAGAGAAPSVGKIAFVRFTAKSGHPRIYTISPNGGAPKLLRLPVAAAQAPAWSPDGRLLAFVAGRNVPPQRDITVGDELYVSKAGGSGVRRLTRDPAHEGGAAWSRDGKRIVFVRTPTTGNRSALWLVGVDGRGTRRLTHGSIDLEPSWSRTGWIAFLRINPRTYQSGIWLVRPDDSGRHRILSGFKNLTNPVWSPDGTRLLVQDGRTLATIRPDGKSRRTITTLTVDAMGNLEDPQPAWSPDGNWVIFCQLRTGSLGRSDIWVVGADGRSLHRLTRSQELDTDPSWAY